MLERDDAPLAALRAENAELRRRISALEAAREVPYERIFENQLVPLVVYRADGLAVAMNGRHAGVLGVPKDAVVGVHNILRDPESRAGGYTEAFEKALKGEIVRMPPTAYNPSRGDVKAGPDRQLWGEAVYVMPIIGAVDRERAKRVIETMLHGVAAHRAKIAILDVTGMAAADDEVASAISRAARAVGLLGASVVLTGIRPEVAAALVSIGVDLAGIVTLSTLQDGIAYALKQ